MPKERSECPIICGGCVLAASDAGLDEKCPFCRAPSLGGWNPYIEQLKVRAAKDDPEALSELGKHFIVGKYVPKDLDKGFELATCMVSLPSRSDLGEYKDLDVQRWLDGLLLARGFQNRVPISSILSVPTMRASTGGATGSGSLSAWTGIGLWTGLGERECAWGGVGGWPQSDAASSGREAGSVLGIHPASS
ncbi:hypothetical protein THAOC_26913, partial [Thalassiosira oceanica]